MEYHIGYSQRDNSGEEGGHSKRSQAGTQGYYGDALAAIKAALLLRYNGKRSLTGRPCELSFFDGGSGGVFSLCLSEEQQR